MQRGDRIRRGRSLELGDGSARALKSRALRPFAPPSDLRPVSWAPKENGRGTAHAPLSSDMAQRVVRTTEARSDLADFLRANRDLILDEWEQAVRELPWGAEIPQLTLIDFMPPLLTRIAELVERFAAGEKPGPPPEAERHALDRLKEGFDLEDVIVELSLLRDCILRLWQGSAGTRPQERTEQSILNQAVDQAIIASVTRYTAAHNRILRVLDRVSSNILEAESLDELLQQLITAFREEAPAVDTVAIFLRDGDELKLHAATGLDEEAPIGTLVPVSDALSGAAEDSSFERKTSMNLPVIEIDAIKKLGTKALHGVPLIDGGELIGVAQMGSFSVNGFSEQDRILFASMATRATAGIYQHMLRGRAEERARELEESERRARQTLDRLAFLARAGELLGSTLDYRKTLDLLTRHAVPIMADWCAVDIVVEPGRSLGDFVAIAHRDPPKVDLVRSLRRRYPPRPDAPHGVAKVLRTGEPELLANLDSESVHWPAVVGDPSDRERLRALALSSFLCVPLIQDDLVIGALSMANAESGRQFDDDDLELAAELARRASVAIQHARLHEESQRAVKLRDRILAIVSHDLRNPIGTIDLASNVLLGNRAIRQDASAKRQLDVIRRGTGRATRLIDDLLDVSSIQAGKLALHLEPCDLAPLLTEAVRAYEPLADEKCIILRDDFRVNARMVRCDHDRTLQALANFLSNSLKFCDPGDTITVSAEIQGREAVISVADTGPGIPTEEAAHIFDLYWKGRRGQRGSGLGLFIAKGIIESHGGRIWIDSRVGEGTAFFFTLPVMPPQPTPDMLGDGDRSANS